MEPRDGSRPAAPAHEVAAGMKALRGDINQELARHGLPPLLTLGMLKDWQAKMPVGTVIVGLDRADIQYGDMTIAVTFRVRSLRGEHHFTMTMNRGSAQAAAVRVIPCVVWENEAYVAVVREYRPTTAFNPAIMAESGGWVADFARGFQGNDSQRQLYESQFDAVAIIDLPADVELQDEDGQAYRVKVLPDNIAETLLRLSLRKLPMLLLQAQPGVTGLMRRQDVRPLHWQWLTGEPENTGNSPGVIHTFLLMMTAASNACLLAACGPQQARVRFHRLRDLLRRDYRQRINMHGELAVGPLILLAEKFQLLK